MKGFDGRIVGPQALAGSAFGAVNPIARPLGSLQGIEVQRRKHGFDLIRGVANLSILITIHARFGKFSAQLPNDVAGFIAGTGHRDAGSVSIHAVSVQPRKVGTSKQGHVQGTTLGDLGVEAQSAEQALVADPRGKHHGVGPQADFTVLISKHHGFDPAATRGQLDPFGAGYPNQPIGEGRGQGTQHGTSLEDRLADPKHLPGNRLENGGAIGGLHGLGTTPKRGSGSKHADSGRQTLSPPDPRAGAGDHGFLQVGTVRAGILGHLKPVGGHVPDGSRGGYIPFPQGVLEASVNDALGTDALAVADGGGFHPDRVEARTSRGIENPEAGDSSSDHQEVDGLFARLGHLQTVPPSSPSGRGILSGLAVNFPALIFADPDKERPVEHGCVLVPGDGIGPEVVAAARRIIDASLAGGESSIRWVERDAGTAALEKGHDSLLPDETVEAIKAEGIALKGPCTTPIGGGFSSVNVALRKTLDLYGAVRPVRSLDGVETRYRDVDIVVVRENTEGLYAGIENEITRGVVTSLKVATDRACRRIAAFAFKYARSRGIGRVTAFHKANIMKLSDGLFIRCAREVHEAEFQDIEYEELIIDAACMRLVQDPSRFGVLLCENLYGDVVSDLCAGFVGGLGVTPGANFGEKNAVFEAVHGSAPDIAGKGVANPLAITMSGVMMLNHLSAITEDPEMGAAAVRIRDAYNLALREGRCTGDLGGDLGTEGFADAVIERF